MQKNLHDKTSNNINNNNMSAAASKDYNTNTSSTCSIDESNSEKHINQKIQSGLYL